MTQATAESGTPNKKSPLYQGFMRRQEEDEKELEALEAERAGTSDNENEEETPDAELNAEEKTYKKRYGDLRRYMQQKDDSHKQSLAELNERIDSLSRQLSESSELPATEEELEEFVKSRPDVARVLETMIAKRLKDQQEDFSTKFKKLEEDQSKTAIERAKVQLMKRHPDLEELEQDDAFHAWVATKSEAIQHNIYNNPTDWQSAADAIDLYKLETGKAKEKKSAKKDNSAASSVKVSTSTNQPTHTGGTPKWSESKVAALTDTDFEKYADEIDDAVQSGNFVYDISGGAR